MFQSSKDEVIEEMFEDFKVNSRNSEYFQSRVLFAATNQIVNEVNNKMVDRMQGDLCCFTSLDTVLWAYEAPVSFEGALCIDNEQLPKIVWTDGQIYVAFLRCGNPKTFVFGQNKNNI